VPDPEPGHFPRQRAFRPAGGRQRRRAEPGWDVDPRTASAATTEFAWPSNDPEGTISRIDTLLNLEVARYATVLKIPGGNPADATGTPDVDEWSSTYNHPSRSTVDGGGNAYVANRAHVGGGKRHGSVTKIAFYDQDLCDMSLALCQCLDRNGNATIETSRDCNGFGINDLGECPDAAVAEGHPRQPNGIDIQNPKEFLAYGDECLLWTVPLPIPAGQTEAWARAMALDPDGNVWVGDYFNRRFYKMNPFDGAFMPPTRRAQRQRSAGSPSGANPTERRRFARDALVLERLRHASRRQATAGEHPHRRRRAGERLLPQERSGRLRDHRRR